MKNNYKKTILLALLALLGLSNANAQWVTVRHNSVGNYKFVSNFNNSTDVYTIYERNYPDAPILLKTAGASWTVLDSVITDKTGLYFKNALTGWLTTSDFSSTKIYKTTDGGITWALETSKSSSDGDYQLIDGYGNFICIAGGSGGSANFRYSNDGGATWDSTTQLPSQTFRTLDVVNDSVAWVGCSNKLMFKTTNGGATWDTTTTVAVGDIYSIFFLNENEGWVVSRSGGSSRIYKTTDAGDSWSNPYTTTGNATKIYFTDNNTGYLLTGSDFRKTTDGGSTWTNLNFTNENNFTTGLGNFYDICFADTIGFIAMEKRVLSTHSPLSTSLLTRDVENEAFSVFPNPANAEINLRMNRNVLGGGVSIFNSLGQLMIEEKITDDQMTISTEQFTNGIYFLKISTGTTSQTIKFIKQ